MGLVPCTIAGCGPGAPELVTPQVRAAASGCEMLAGVPRLLALFPESRAERLVYEGGLEPFLAELAPHLGHRRVTVLVTGDPGIASLATTLARRFPDQPFRRLPGISSVQLAFAETGLDQMDAILIRAHSGVPVWDAAWEHHRGPFAVLAGHAEAPVFTSHLARFRGRGHIWRCERLSLAGARAERITPDALECEGCDPLSVLIIEGERP